MNPAQFNRRIFLFKRTITTDDLLQEIETFEQVAKPWAMIKTLKGEEAQNAGPTTINTSRFIVRYSKILHDLFEQEKTSLEIHYRGVIYDIKSAINDDEANLTFTIIAEGRM